MNWSTVRTIAFTSFSLALIPAAAWQAKAQDAKTPYPSMAPVDQYMMERKAEITLAQSAAPESISKDAEVLSSARMGTKPRSKARTVSCASSNGRGRLESMSPIFGIPKCGPPSASTRRERDRTFP
jgi:hypothetical protein